MKVTTVIRPSIKLIKGAGFKFQCCLHRPTQSCYRSECIYLEESHYIGRCYVEWAVEKRCRGSPQMEPNSILLFLRLYVSANLYTSYDGFSPSGVPRLGHSFLSPSSVLPAIGIVCVDLQIERAHPINCPSSISSWNLGPKVFSSST